MTSLPHRKRARLVARQVSELLIARGERWFELGPRERLPAIIIGVVLSASIAHHPFRDPVTGDWIGLEEAGVLGRPVSATAIAHSMGLPHTTVRRRAAELVGAGWLVRDAAGFRIGPGLFADGRLARIAEADAADLFRILAALAEAGWAPAARAMAAEPGGLAPGLIERLLLAFTLRTLETFTTLYGDVVAGVIAAAITAANVRQVTGNLELARRYADEDHPPPDALREPIGLRPLARQVAIPFETVRRRVNALIEEGVVVWKGDGVIVPAHVLLDARHIANNRRIAGHFEQLADHLAALASEGRRRPGGAGLPR